MQQEATAGALIYARRRMDETDQGLRALAHMSAWCRSNTVEANGLDIPGHQNSALGQFMQRMAEARGGIVTGPFWAA